MKQYYGHAATPERSTYVTARDRGGPEVITHHVRHSPTGFEWGYSGEAPSDLARSLLLDAFSVVSCPTAPEDCRCENRWVEASYGAFRDKVIAAFTKEEDWRYTQGSALDFVFDYTSDLEHIELVTTTP